MLVLQKSVFIEPKATLQYVAMQKRFRQLMATRWKKFF